MKLKKKIYIVGGRNSTNQRTNTLLSFDLDSGEWNELSAMSTAREGAKLVWYQNEIWALGGYDSEFLDSVESYDPVSDTWQSRTSLPQTRGWAIAWTQNGEIYVGGGRSNGGHHHDSVIKYDTFSDSWINVGTLPEIKYVADATVLNGYIFVISGDNSISLSDKSMH